MRRLAYVLRLAVFVGAAGPEYESSKQQCLLSEGVLSGDGHVCCAASCGRCGGAGCQRLIGGSAKCCQGAIWARQRYCSSARAPCLSSSARGRAPPSGQRNVAGRGGWIARWGGGVKGVGKNARSVGRGAASRTCCPRGAARSLPAFLERRVVLLAPLTDPALSIRHWHERAYLTRINGLPTYGGTGDHAFALEPALNGEPAAVSLRVTNWLGPKRTEAIYLVVQSDGSLRTAGVCGTNKHVAEIQHTGSFRVVAGLADAGMLSLAWPSRGRSDPRRFGWVAQGGSYLKLSEANMEDRLTSATGVLPSRYARLVLSGSPADDGRYPGVRRSADATWLVAMRPTVEAAVRQAVATSGTGGGIPTLTASAPALNLSRSVTHSLLRSGGAGCKTCLNCSDSQRLTDEEELGPAGSTLTCYNNCFGRGTCVRGICACPPPFFGWDCGSTTESGFVYVYDIPASSGRQSYVRKEKNSDPIYKAEDLFVRRLMSDFKVRTLDPHKASLFYVPTFIYYAQSNIAFIDQHYAHLKSILARLPRRLRFWGRNAPNGSDHVFFWAGDKGACFDPSGSDVWQPRAPIFISQFGLQTPWSYMGREHQYAPGGTGGPAARIEAPCTAAEDIVIPPQIKLKRTDIEAVAAARRAIIRPNEAHPSYKYELSFAGSIFGTMVRIGERTGFTADPFGETPWPGVKRMRQAQLAQLQSRGALHSAAAANFVAAGGGAGGGGGGGGGGGRGRRGGDRTPLYHLPKAPRGANATQRMPTPIESSTHYSQRVRQLIWLQHRHRQRFLLREGYAPVETFGTSRFCLAPTGDGYGVRLVKAIRLGCVPLIIQPKVRLPFDEILPYDEFSLRLEIEHIPLLHTILARVTPERHAAMRAALLKHADSFVYETCHESPGGCAATPARATAAGPKGRAYDHLVHMLRLRGRVPAGDRDAAGN